MVDKALLSRFLTYIKLVLRLEPAYVNYIWAHIWSLLTKMDRLIEQQIFALDMDVLTNRMQCLQKEKWLVFLDPSFMAKGL